MDNKEKLTPALADTQYRGAVAYEVKAGSESDFQFDSMRTQFARTALGRSLIGWEIFGSALTHTAAPKDSDALSELLYPTVDLAEVGKARVVHIPSNALMAISSGIMERFGGAIIECDDEMEALVNHYLDEEWGVYQLCGEIMQDKLILRTKDGLPIEASIPTVDVHLQLGDGVRLPEAIREEIIAGVYDISKTQFIRNDDEHCALVEKARIFVQQMLGSYGNTSYCIAPSMTTSIENGYRWNIVISLKAKCND